MIKFLGWKGETVIKMTGTRYLTCEKTHMSILRIFLKGIPQNIRPEYVWEVRSRDKYLEVNGMKSITKKRPEAIRIWSGNRGVIPKDKRKSAIYLHFR